MSLEVIQVPPSELQQAPLAECATLQEVVATLDTRVRKNGRVICAVLVNGHRLSEEDEVRLSAMGLDEIHSLEFETDDPKSLVQSTLEAQLLLMTEMEKLGKSAGQAFRELDIGRGQGLLIQLLDGCRWLTDALVALKAAQSWMQALEIDKSQWVQSEQQFHRVIAEILATVEHQDYVLLADLLQFELANGLDGWRRLIADVQKKGPQPQK